MPCPSLQDLLRELESYKKERPYVPSRIWTRTEALDCRREASAYLDLERRRNELGIKKDSIEPLAFFHTAYSTTGTYRPSKCSAVRFAKMTKDLYKVTNLVFNSEDIREFTNDISSIIRLGESNFGKVRQKDRRFLSFLKNMDMLQVFWDLNTKSGDGTFDGRGSEIGLLRKSMISVYIFMRCHSVEY